MQSAAPPMAGCLELLLPPRAILYVFGGTGAEARRSVEISSASLFRRVYGKCTAGTGAGLEVRRGFVEAFASSIQQPAPTPRDKSFYIPYADEPIGGLGNFADGVGHGCPARTGRNGDSRVLSGRDPAKCLPASLKAFFQGVKSALPMYSAASPVEPRAVCSWR